MPRDAFRIVIEGTGQHHESSTEDADYLAKRLVIDLGNKGHQVTNSSFTPGGPDLQTGGDAQLLEDRLDGPAVAEAPVVESVVLDEEDRGY